jgi:Acyl-CoA dehydrogenase, C-terminal domain
MRFMGNQLDLRLDGLLAAMATRLGRSSEAVIHVGADEDEDIGELAEALVDAGLLLPAEPSSALICDGCERNCVMSRRLSQTMKARAGRDRPTTTLDKPICEHQAIQLKLADMVTQVRAARLLVEDAARAYDKGERCDMEAGMAKLFASEASINVSLEAMRIHGGYGYSKEFTVERLYRDAPLLVIGEGTNELQRIIIARQLIQRNPV